MANRLVAIVEPCDDATVSKTLEGIVTTWNPGAARIFGWSAEGMVGRSILTVYDGSTVDHVASAIFRVTFGLWE